MSILYRNYVKGPSLSRRPVFQSHIGFCSKYQGQSQGRAVFGGNMKGRELREATPPLQSPLLHKVCCKRSAPKRENSSSCCVVPEKQEAAIRFDIFTEVSLPQDKGTPCRPSAMARVWVVPTCWLYSRVLRPCKCTYLPSPNATGVQGSPASFCAPVMSA